MINEENEDETESLDEYGLLLHTSIELFSNPVAEYLAVFLQLTPD